MKIIQPSIRLALLFFSILTTITSVHAQWIASDTGYSALPSEFMLTSESILVGALDGVYASFDDGHHWEQSSAGIPDSNAIYCFGVNSAGLYAAGERNLYRSSDNGQSWSGLSLGEFNIFELATVNDVLYAADIDTGLIMSVDNGSNWNLVNIGVPNLRAYCLLNKGDTLFVGTVSNGLFMSPNAGFSWMQLSNGIPSISTIRCLETDGVRVFAGTSQYGALPQGLYYSNDGGTSWIQSNSGISTNANVFSIYDAGTALLAASHDIYRSLDYGVTWEVFMDSIDISCPYGASSFIANESFVLAGFEGTCGTQIHRMSLLDLNLNTGVSEIQPLGTEVRIFPNPATDILHIQSENDIDRVEIYDIRGKLVMTVDSRRRAAEQLDVSGLPRGLYVLMVETETTSVRRRLLVN